MRIIVCGGRNVDESDAIRHFVIELANKIDNGIPHLVAQGGAPGVDSTVKTWCDRYGVPCATFKANWALHGKSAGPKRNAAMLAVIDPDLVVAFSGGRGTADMVRRAHNAGVPVTHITPARPTPGPP